MTSYSTGVNSTLLDKLFIFMLMNHVDVVAKSTEYCFQGSAFNIRSFLLCMSTLGGGGGGGGLGSIF